MTGVQTCALPISVRRGDVVGGQAPDQRDDVVGGRPGRLGDDDDAVEPRPQRGAGHASAPERGDQSGRLGEDRRSGILEGRVDRRSGCPRVTTATELPGQDRRVDAARLGPDADPGGRALLLEQDGDLGRLRLRQEVGRASCRERVSTIV